MKMQKYEMRKCRSIDFFKRLNSNRYEEGELGQWLKRKQTRLGTRKVSI